MGSERRPDVVGLAFGAFLVVALVAVGVRLLISDGGLVPGPLARLLPGRDARVGEVAARDSFGQWQGDGLGLPLPPLYVEGPREIPTPEPWQPDELWIPGIDVRSRFVHLNKRADGTMEVPGDFMLAGWYVGSPAPGRVGPAVIAGHLDSRRGPAIFANIEKLKAGDAIEVRRGDGKVVRYVVERLASYPKDQFPTAEVYGDTAGPELRLITCDGTFDRNARSYRENLVVYAKAAPRGVPPEPTPTPSNDFSDAATPAPEPSSSEAASSAPSPAPSPAPSASQEADEQPPSPEPSNTPSPRPSGRLLP